MNKRSIEERVKKIISSKFKIAMDKINLRFTFVNDLGLDRLDVVELVMALEEEFNSAIPDEDITTFTTVDDLVKHIRDRNTEDVF